MNWDATPSNIINQQSSIIDSVLSVVNRLKLHIGVDIDVFKGLGNLADLGAIMKQAQEMGSRMQALSAELKTKRATGSAGGGMVEIEVNGLAEVIAVRIDPSLIEKQDREMIEDLLPAAFNIAQQKAKQMHAEAMESITGGMQVPGLQDALSQLSGKPPSGDSD